MSINPDIVLGWPYPRREEYIKELEDIKGRYDYPLKFLGPLKPYPVYPVEIDFPKYRLTNGRTQAVQEMYLAKNPELGQEFFTRDFELDQAQAVQHELLLSMIENTQLMRYFKNSTNTQDFSINPNP